MRLKFLQQKIPLMVEFNYNFYFLTQQPQNQFIVFMRLLAVEFL